MTFIFWVANINKFTFDIKIDKFSLSKLFKIIIMAIFDFGLSIFNFYFNILINRFFRISFLLSLKNYQFFLLYYFQNLFW